MSKKAPINLWGSDSSDSEDKKDIQMKPKKKVAIVAPIQDVSDEHDEISQEDEEEENVDGENDVSFDDNDDDESNEENSDAEADENEDQDVQESDNEQVDPNNEDAPFSVSVDIDQEESSEEDETHEIQEQHADIPSEEEIPLEDVSEGKPKFVKPLDYKLLKEKTNETGVIFLTQPPAEWQNEDRLVEFFEEYGKINRIKPSYQTKGKKKYLLGYYIEFQRKSVAKRVALTLNMQPIDNRDTRVLQIKYVQNFEWTELEEGMFFCLFILR